MNFIQYYCIFLQNSICLLPKYHILCYYMFMDKYNISKDEKMTVSNIMDRHNRCLNKNILTCTDFLDLNAQTLVKEMEREFKTDYILWGGFEDAERKVLFFLPEYEVDIKDEIKILKVSHTPNAELTHRHFLGSVLNCGIKRDKTGDILVSEGFAQILIKTEIADFLDTNYFKAGRVPISTDILDVDEIVIPEQKYREITDTVSSLRLDSIVSTAFRLSRENAKQAISSKLVYVNDVLCTKSDRLLSEGDKVKLHKKGRALLSQVGSVSKKGRIFITLKVPQ